MRLGSSLSTAKAANKHLQLQSRGSDGLFSGTGKACSRFILTVDLKAERSPLLEAEAESFRTGGVETQGMSPADLRSSQLLDASEPKVFSWASRSLALAKAS